MSLVAAIVVSAATAPATHAPVTCPGCTLDAPSHGDAIPMLVVLREDRDDRDDHDTAPSHAGGWHEPARARGWAILTLVGWERDEPGWIAAQVRETARLLPIDLAHVYLIGTSAGAIYVAQHLQPLSETFAALVITGGGARPAARACPEQALPAYFLVDARDTGARELRSYLERCKQPVVWNAGRAPRDRPLDQKSVLIILDWLHHHARVTTVAAEPLPDGYEPLPRPLVDLVRSRVMLAGCASPLPVCSR
jgi:hypothetical protein